MGEAELMAVTIDLDLNILIASIVDDWRAYTVGGFLSSLLLWESCCVSSLLYNSGSWIGMSHR